MVYTGSNPNLVVALKAGGAQAGAENPLVEQQLRALGFNDLFDLVDLNLPTVENVVVVQRSFAASRKDVLQSYVDAIVESMLREKADRAYSIQVAEKYLQNNDAQKIGGAVDFYTQKLQPVLPYLNADQFGDTVTKLSANDPQIANLDISRFIDNSYVQGAADE